MNRKINRKKLLGVVFLFVLIIVINGCGLWDTLTVSKGSQQAEREYAVAVQDSVFFEATITSGIVGAGDSFVTELIYEEGYCFESCNYDEIEVEQIEQGVRLTVPDINHDYRIVVKTVYNSESRELSQVDFETVEKTIVYHANGGCFDNNLETMTETYELSYHFRANTSLGDNLSREGFVLNGWNTKPDGTGVHVGLGSRTDYSELFAEWLPSVSIEALVYKKTSEGIILTGYKGSGDISPFVIPEQIDGKPVIQIDTSFTTNMPCGRLSGGVLVLPKTIKYINTGAFNNSAFEEIYFYDSLEKVSDGAFPPGTKYYHINAATGPSFQEENDNARFSDKIDYLMQQEGKRLVIYAGCSASYGIKSLMLQEAFPEYSVCNMGVIGGVNSIFQMQIIEHFLREGDVFVHLPEQMSAFQLMSYISVDYRVFIMTEGNYDLLSLADFSYTTTFWEGYNTYKTNKNGQDIGKYSDGKQTYNKYGDIVVGRPFEEENAWERDVSYSDYDYQFDIKKLTDSGIELLCGFYDKYRELGVAVYIGYAPVNINGLEDIQTAYEYETEFVKKLSKHGYKPVGQLSGHLFKGRYFYDSDYHLNDFGSVLQTRQLINDLKETALGGE